MFSRVCSLLNGSLELAKILKTMAEVWGQSRQPRREIIPLVRKPVVSVHSAREQAMTHHR